MTGIVYPPFHPLDLLWLFIVLVTTHCILVALVLVGRLCVRRRQPKDVQYWKGACSSLHPDSLQRSSFRAWPPPHPLLVCQRRGECWSRGCGVWVYLIRS